MTISKSRPAGWSTRRPDRCASPPFVSTKGPGTPGGLAAFQAALQVPLGVMVADGEIMGAQVVIPPGQNILSTGRLRARLRIIPVPIMREIEVEIGLDNPFATATSGASQAQV